MRLGGYFQAEKIEDLEPLCEKLDNYGLSAITAPNQLGEMSPDACSAFGQKARDLGIVIGEAGMWQNLLTADQDHQRDRIDLVRSMLVNADQMDCHCVVALFGTKDPSDNPIAPHPYLYTDECKNEFQDVVLRILDGLELKTVKFAIESWHNTFFYQPEEIRTFIDRVDHPMFGAHLDPMNMVSQQSYFQTTALINRTLDLLAEDVVSVHLKDIRCDFAHMFLKYDEVYIGDGVMDYQTLLARLMELPPDTPCFCEHMSEERDYALNFARLHHKAALVGVHFLKRGE